MTHQQPAEPTPESVSRTLGALVFLGTEPSGSDASGSGELSTPAVRDLAAHCRSEADRLAGTLAAHGRTLGSLLVLDVVYDPEQVDAEEARAVLADVLPSEARPCLTAIPVLPGSLGGRSPLALQGVSTAEPVVPAGPDRFPQAAGAGELIAVAGQSTDTDDDMVTQTSEVMDRVADLLRAHGAGWDDAVRFDVFYRAEGTAEGWAANARERARRFMEPGPATTGIPVGFLPGRAKILLRTMAVRGARGLGLRSASWPSGHWDWPFHLPYKHGIGAAGTVFVGGQVSLAPDASVIDPDDLAAQTSTSVDNILKVAAELSLGAHSVLRLIAFYRHTGPDDGATVRQVVQDRLADHTYQLTLVGLPYLAYERMVVEIEAELR
ncbi:RidA family protein [Streptomyces sp. NPDC056821]|uniref:RidA family protein n=1 Tax=unclassified Streptomyces TaxID=2593676 RepID=UPI0036B070FB